MKTALNAITSVIQVIMAIAILVGRADIRTIAWYWLISSATMLILLTIIGAIEAERK